MLLFGITTPPLNIITSYPASPGIAISLREMPGLGYTGYLVRLVRASDFASEYFYQGATPWSLNTVRGGGGTDALTWAAGTNAEIWYQYRQDGSESIFRNDVIGRRPKLISGGVYLTAGGYPCARYAVADLTYMTIDGTLPTSQIPLAEFMIGKRASSASGGVFLSHGADASNWSLRRDTDNHLKTKYTDNYMITTSTNTTSDFEVLGCSAKSGETRYRSNLGEIANTVSAAGPNTATTFNEIGRLNAGGSYTDGDVVEYAMYKQDLSAEFDNMVDFISGEFSL